MFQCIFFFILVCFWTSRATVFSASFESNWSSLTRGQIPASVVCSFEKHLNVGRVWCHNQQKTNRWMKITAGSFTRCTQPSLSRSSDRLECAEKLVDWWGEARLPLWTSLFTARKDKQPPNKRCCCLNGVVQSSALALRDVTSSGTAKFTKHLDWCVERLESAWPCAGSFIKVKASNLQQKRMPNKQRAKPAARCFGIVSTSGSQSRRHSSPGVRQWISKGRREPLPAPQRGKFLSGKVFRQFICLTSRGGGLKHRTNT